MGKCLRCGKSTGLFSNKKVCDRCRIFLVSDVEARTDNIKKMILQINHGFKNIDPYLSRLTIIADEFNRIEECKKYIKVETYGNIHSIDDIIDFANDRINECTEKAIEKSYTYKKISTSIDKLNEYGAKLEACIEYYPLFTDSLKNNLKTIDNVIELLLKEEIKDEKDKLK